MSIDEKIEAIKTFAVDLTDLASSYSDMVTVTHKASPEMIDFLYRVSVELNALNMELFQELPK